MKQKSRIVSKLFAALVILTLISCCFLGSTFARYTSQTTGTASVSVAKWDVDITNDDSNKSWKTKVEFAKLSPSMAYSENVAQSNSTGKVLVASAVNNSDVFADLKLTINDWKLTFNSPDVYPGADGACPSYDMVYGVFTVNIYNGDALVCTVAANKDGVTEIKNWGGGEQGRVNLYAEVVWTTNYAGTFADGWDADKLDTWIGENIASLGFTINCTAVQASMLPGNN